MNFSTSPVDIRPDHIETVREILRAHLPAEFKVWVFGSRANWTTKDSSDLDLAVEGPASLGHKAMVALEVAFEESNLPFTVDVVDLNVVSHSFKQIVKEQRVPLLLDGDGTKQKVRLAGSASGGSPSATATLTATSGKWRQAMLGDLLSFSNGTSSPERSDELPHPVYGSNGIIGFSDEANSNPHAIVIGRVGSYCGSLYFSKKHCWVTDNAIRANSIDDNDAKFLFYLLQTLHLNEWRAGSGQPLLNQTILSSIPTTVPPLPEQRAIAHVLGTLDDKIELNRRMNETLEDMARALFKSWFVDFDPVRAKMEGRDTGLPPEVAALFPDRLVDSELGEIPEGWEVKALGEMVDVVGGTTPSTKVAEYWSGGTHCWATPKDLSDLSSPVLLDTERQVTDAGLEKIGSGLLPMGTVLLSSRAPIGYLAVSEKPVAINQGFIAMPPRDGTSNLFLLHWCSAFHEEIINHANGSTFLEISKGNFRRIPMSIAGEAVMDAFDRQARALHERIVANEREAGSLAAERDALLPRLVSGEVRVGVAASVEEIAL